MTPAEAAKILAEFNKWRRGDPPYDWIDDPAKRKKLTYTPKQIGEAIDIAVRAMKGENQMNNETTKSDEIIVHPSPSADTRSADHIITEDELRLSTEMHIADVRRGMAWLARRLYEIGERHDWTKLSYLDEFYDQFSKAQKTGEWGNGWYDEIHVKKERHHLNDEMPSDVTLLDVLEMIVDGVCAGMARTGKYYPGELDAETLKLAYANMQKMIAAAVRVAGPSDETSKQ